MVRIGLGDCLYLLKNLRDGSVDMVLADLPYGTTACKWDIVIPFEPLWAELHRVCKLNAAIVMFGSEPFSSKLRMSNLKRFKYDWIWYKNKGSNFMTAKKQPLKFHEIVSVFYERQPIYNPIFEDYSDSVYKRHKNNQTINTDKWNRQGKIDSVFGVFAGVKKLNFERGKFPSSVKFFKIDHTANFNRKHPTQKPVALLEYLIKTYTNEGDTVLDPTMGSGSTGVACINLRRNFIGIEKEQKYFDTAQQRQHLIK